MIVEIDQVFSHCPKAFMRSQLWQPATWPAGRAAVDRPAVQGGAGPTDETLEELEEYYAPENYSGKLY